MQNLLPVLEEISLCGNHTALHSNSSVSLCNSSFKLVDLIVELNDVKGVDVVG